MTALHRPTVLVLLGCFGRGIEATGPNQNLLGMVSAFPSDYHFRVVAAAVDGDLPGRWQLVSGIEQLPLESGTLGTRGLRRAIIQTEHDMLITNGFFDQGFTIPLLVMRRLGLVRRKPLLLGVHGEFSRGALDIRSKKKKAYIAFARAARLLDGVTLQATSELEASEIRSALPFYRGEIAVTPVIRAIPPLPAHRLRAPGEPLRVVFLSRIDTKKNLEYALDRLAESELNCEFDIFGPVSDEAYWASCRQHIQRMPEWIKVTHKGTISQADVIPVLAQYDLFFLPTWGENYGHAIVDALCAGTPVLISDQTPWRGLEQSGAGWNLSLGTPHRFVAALREVAARTSSELEAARLDARRLAEAALDVATSAEATRHWLERCCRRAAVR